jgi:hypothetical protein
MVSVTDATSGEEPAAVVTVVWRPSASYAEVVEPRPTSASCARSRAVGFGPTTAAQLRLAGRIETAEWLDWAETQWANVRREDETSSLSARLDHLHHLSAQAGRHRFIVLFASSGARPVSAVLDSHAFPLPFVARDKTYWASFADIREADFVSGFLNSDWVASRIEAWQTRGLFGTRDIHKRPLAVPWPTFEPGNADHSALATRSGRLRQAARDGLPDVPPGTVGRMRTQLRALLPQADLIAVEEFVARISTQRAQSLVDNLAPAEPADGPAAD